MTAERRPRILVSLGGGDCLVDPAEVRAVARHGDRRGVTIHLRGDDGPSNILCPRCDDAEWTLLVAALRAVATIPGGGLRAGVEFLSMGGGDEEP